MEDGSELDKLKKEKDLGLLEAQLDKYLAKAGLAHTSMEFPRKKLESPESSKEQSGADTEELERKIRHGRSEGS